MHNACAGQLWGLGSADVVVLAVVPMFHITGVVSMMHTTVLVGGTLVIMPRWDRDVAGRLISRRKVTSWTNIPTMVIDLMASPNFASYDLSSLSYIGGGGAAMPQAVAQRLFEQFGLKYQEGYGLTETAAPSHANPFENPKQQCLGIPYMSTDARVVDPDTLVPQGGGDRATGHRCPGEAVTLAMIESAVRALARLPHHLPPQDTSSDLSRIPTRPRSGAPA